MQEEQDQLTHWSAAEPFPAGGDTGLCQMLVGRVGWAVQYNPPQPAAE